MDAVPWYVFVGALGAGACMSPTLAVAMLAIHARTEITLMKRALDRLVWPMSQKEFTEMQYTWSAFTQKFYGDSGNFMSHREVTQVKPEFKKKLEARLGISV